MFLPELGHVLDGHLKDLKIRSEQADHSEFRMLAVDEAEDADLQQLREYQADSVRAYLATHIIEELIEDSNANERMRQSLGQRMWLPRTQVTSYRSTIRSVRL